MLTRHLLLQQNAGASVGETEWHRSDRGDHQTHYMRDGSSANTYSNVMLTQTHRQPLSEENALAMQCQEESLLALQMAHSHLEEQEGGGPQNADVGRTDSKRGVRGAMAPMHSSAEPVGERHPSSRAVHQCRLGNAVLALMQECPGKQCVRDLLLCTCTLECRCSACDRERNTASMHLLRTESQQ